MRIRTAIFTLRLFLFCALVTIFCSSGYGQDPQFSQYYANQVLLNPAFTGAADGPRVVMNYRRQWVAIPGSFRTMAFAYDQNVFFGKTEHGLGVTVLTDRAGEGNLTKLDLMANYSYKLMITRPGAKLFHAVRFGLAGGIQQSSIDFFRLRFPDQIDPRDGQIYQTQERGFNQSYMIPDFQTGLLYYNNYAYFSITANHLTEPTQRFFTGALGNNADPKLPRKITVTGGVNIPFGPKSNPDMYNITPVFIYKTQGNFDQIDLGAYFTFEPIVLGMYYRGSSQTYDVGGEASKSDWGSDALIGLVGFRKGIFSFAYSYDYTISTLQNRVSGGSHELALIMEFERNRKTKFKHRKMPCPRF